MTRDAVFLYRTTTLARSDAATPGASSAAIRAFAQSVKSIGALALARQDGVLIGLWRAQLGFAANEVTTLTAFADPGRADDAALFEASIAMVADSQVERLRATARPRDLEARPAPGGIVVHRWFHVDAPKVARFAALSAEAWETFEQRFEAKVYGLFEAEASEEDRARDRRRLLLLTWYADHGAWEASRDEARDPEAWKRFQERQAMTQWTIGRSAAPA